MLEHPLAQTTTPRDVDAWEESALPKIELGDANLEEEEPEEPLAQPVLALEAPAQERYWEWFSFGVSNLIFPKTTHNSFYAMAMRPVRVLLRSCARRGLMRVCIERSGQVCGSWPHGGSSAAASRSCILHCTGTSWSQ